MGHPGGNNLIHAAVGANAPNHHNDVATIQHLLNRTGLVRPVLMEDGIAGRLTIGHIRQYQQTELKFAQPDGRVDPGGATLRGLLRRAATGGSHAQQGSAAPPHRQARTEAAVRAEHHSAISSAGAGQRIGNPAAAAGKLTPQDFADAATRLGAGIEPALVHAIADVESGGKSGFWASGLPIIAYEGHIFRKYSHRAYDQSHPLLSYPYRVKAGPEWRQHNKDQDTAWATLKSAAELDHDAALMACSWGMFQVMGFNYATCGYKSVDAFVDAMKAGEKGQLDAFVGFCRSQSGMIAAMARKDFAAIASSYNGADYGDYDRRIERAYNKYKA